MALATGESLKGQMERLDKIRAENPEHAANIIASGKLLVQLAREGKLHKIRNIVQRSKPEDILIFYKVQMFRLACLNGKMDIIKYMVDNGFDASHVSLRELLHSFLEETLLDKPMQPMIMFLLQHGHDINEQRKRDLYSPLHIACMRSMYELACFLVLCGADVNSVAKDDDMPLVCAERAASLPNVNREDNKKLIAFLIGQGAKTTWRQVRNSTTTTSSGATAEDTSVIVHGSGMLISRETSSSRSISSPPSSVLASISSLDIEEPQGNSGILLDTVSLNSVNFLNNEQNSCNMPSTTTVTVSQNGPLAPPPVPIQASRAGVASLAGLCVSSHATLFHHPPDRDYPTEREDANVP